MPQTHPERSDGTLCWHCGVRYSWFEFAETIEEYLCERCASGIEEDEDYTDGQEWGFDDA